jgi:cytochrome c peroxidase
MKKTIGLCMLLFVMAISLVQCTKSTSDVADTYPAIEATFGSNINPASFANYAGQAKPAYITKDNAVGFVLNNAKATLGRVLFYDKSLSIDNTISCGSCHKQTFAFSDTALASKGVQGGLTARHSMRLVNVRFGREAKFFWDERAATLEQQTTMPIQDHAEMGFSGQNGRGNLNTLLTKLQGINYYNELFKLVYGDINVTEVRLQESLSHFIRSIQSFDSKFDVGRAQVPNNAANFPNFTAQENTGKTLFLAAPVFDANGVRTTGGAGCNGCHNAPEFDIDPNTRNNGIIGRLNATGFDLGITRSPTLRDLVNNNGELNGPLMHTGVITSLQAAVGHYNTINANPANNNLDPRLRPGGNGQQLNLNATEMAALTSFLRTLSGVSMYTDTKWSNPFK